MTTNSGLVGSLSPRNPGAAGPAAAAESKPTVVSLWPESHPRWPTSAPPLMDLPALGPVCGIATNAVVRRRRPAYNNKGHSPKCCRSQLRPRHVTTHCGQVRHKRRWGDPPRCVRKPGSAKPARDPRNQTSSRAHPTCQRPLPTEISNTKFWTLHRMPRAPVRRPIQQTPQTSLGRIWTNFGRLRAEPG